MISTHSSLFFSQSILRIPAPTLAGPRFPGFVGSCVDDEAGCRLLELMAIEENGGGLDEEQQQEYDRIKYQASLVMRSRREGRRLVAVFDLQSPQL